MNKRTDDRSEFNWHGLTGHRYEVVVFDWDGTAVRDRSSDATDLLRALESLLNLGVICVVVTGTKLSHLDKQCLRYLSNQAKQSLFVCTNRGSEVFGYKESGEPNLLFGRKASEEENQALDAAAKALQMYLAGFGLSTEIIFDRLNRRKIDLIPEPRWSNPKKSELPELLAAVNLRLMEARISGNMQAILFKATQIASVSGLDSPRLTSDIKHIEIGLTDKADSQRWIWENIVGEPSNNNKSIAIIGDEFGPVAGVAGSDSFMRIPELENADFFSVGAEPGGVPDGVVWLGGGPGRFVEFLRRQTMLYVLADNIATLEEQSRGIDTSWEIEEVGLDPSREREMETIFAAGNGYLTVRGGLGLGLPISQSDLILAGVYSQKMVKFPYSELQFKADDRMKHAYTEIVPFPFPFGFKLKIDGLNIEVEELEHLREYRRKLDIMHGVYSERHHFLDKDGNDTEVYSKRFASMSNLHLLFQDIEVTCSGHDQLIDLDLSITKENVALTNPHLASIPTKRPANLAEILRYRTKASAFEVCLGTKIFCNGELQETPKISKRVAAGETCNIRRIIGVYTNRETPNPSEEVTARLREQDFEQWQLFVEFNRRWWRRYWRSANIQYIGTADVSLPTRFNLYQLRIAADHDPRVSVPAKTLTGRAYEGHVFWDAEIFVLPCLLYSTPHLARQLLCYRYNTLDGAKKRAQSMGYQGACYAWESTVTGEDVTPKKIIISGKDGEIPIFTGEQQIHVTADVAYGVWRYWTATVDVTFMKNWGIEILIETARFWADRVTLRQESYHIDDVVGPDEYHHGVNDNAYTNWMARFNLSKALQALKWLEKYDNKFSMELREQVHLDAKALEQWSDIASRLHVPEPNEDGIIEQFDGFFHLKDFEIPHNERHQAPVSRLFKWNEVNEIKLCKQADVLMIPYLFPDAFSKQTLKANFDYYERRTDHGSSLSPGVHAAIAARLGYKEKMDRYWQLSLNMDLKNVMKNTPLGFHAGCAGATWQTLILHMVGVQFKNDDVAMTPSLLPNGVNEIRTKLLYRGKWRHIHVKGRP